jgi:hypothetical protein
MPTTKKKAPAPKAASKAAAKTTTKSAAKKKPAAPPPPVVHVSAYSVGNRVSHPVFGEGKVTAIDRDQLSIQFANSEKVVLESFVKSAGKG